MTKKFYHLPFIKRSELSKRLSEKIGKPISEQLFYRKQKAGIINKFGDAQEQALEEIRLEIIEELQSCEPVINFKNADL